MIQSHRDNIKNETPLGAFHSPALQCSVGIVQHKIVMKTMVTTTINTCWKNYSPHTMVSAFLAHHPFALPTQCAMTLQSPSNHSVQENTNVVMGINLQIRTSHEEKQGHICSWYPQYNISLFSIQG
jgi:hypothetical protein